MTEGVPPGNVRPARATIRRSNSTGALVGLPILLGFLWRRNWLRLVIWTVVLIGMIPLVYESQRATFPTAADRQAYAAIANTPSVATLTGTPYAADTLGGILVLKIWMTLAISLAFATTFLVARNGRAEEEDGRTELLRSDVVGRHAYSAANYLLVAVFNVVVGAGIAITAAAMPLPVDGSLLLGASLAATGLFFLGVAAVAGQFTATSRGANGLSALAIGVAFVVRAVGDLNGVGTQPGWMSSFSPIGWAQQMRAFGENHWWPLAPLLGGAAVLISAALWIESRRDLGSGLLAQRAGSAEATPFTTTALGLALRLQRGSLAGWFAIMIVMSVLYGSVATAMANLLGTNPVFLAVFGAKGSTVLDGVVGLLLLLNAMVVSAFVVESVLQVRAEEASGRAEAQLAGSISRLRWAGAKLLLPVVASGLMLAVGGLAMGLAYEAAKGGLNQMWPILAGSVLYWPGVLVSAGVAVLLMGVAPRLAPSLSWAYVAVLVGISVFGGLFSLPDAVISHTPLTATPRLPGASFDALPLLILSAIAVLLWGVGLRRFAARDLAQGA